MEKKRKDTIKKQKNTSWKILEKRGVAKHFSDLSAEQEKQDTSPIPSIWKEPLSKRDEAFEFWLEFFGPKSYRIEAAKSKGNLGPWPDIEVRVENTPEDIKAIRHSIDASSFSQKTQDSLKRVELMEPLSAFMLGYCIGVHAGEAQANEYGPAASSVDGKKGAGRTDGPARRAFEKYRNDRNNDGADATWRDCKNLLKKEDGNQLQLCFKDQGWNFRKSDEKEVTFFIIDKEKKEKKEKKKSWETLKKAFYPKKEK